MDIMSSQELDQKADAATFLATTPGPKLLEEIPEEEPMKKSARQKVKPPTMQENIKVLLEKFERLERKVSFFGYAP